MGGEQRVGLVLLWETGLQRRRRRSSGGMRTATVLGWLEHDGFGLVFWRLVEGVFGMMPELYQSQKLNAL